MICELKFIPFARHFARPRLFLEAELSWTIILLRIGVIRNQKLAYLLIVKCVDVPYLTPAVCKPGCSSTRSSSIAYFERKHPYKPSVYRNIACCLGLVVYWIFAYDAPSLYKTCDFRDRLIFPYKYGQLIVYKYVSWCVCAQESEVCVIVNVTITLRVYSTIYTYMYIVPGCSCVYMFMYVS